MEDFDPELSQGILEICRASTRISIAVTIACLIRLLEIGTAKVVVMKNSARYLGNLRWTKCLTRGDFAQEIRFRMPDTRCENLKNSARVIE